MKHSLETLVIRKITHNDLPDLEWEGEFKHFRRLYINAYQNQQNGNAVLWVAELLESGIIGQVFVQLSGSRLELADGQFRAYIYSVRIKRKFRNLGIGSKIMRHAEQDILQRGYSFATLNVGKQNVKARRFYQRLGYQVISDEPGNWSYLDHQGIRRYVHEPSWRMQKQLKPV
ncbi:MAG: GNAT family N-acetyltransferase [Anaerolineales bacterium]|jgi:ribosomal protein S18 acetylase RimI-like enzyme